MQDISNNITSLPFQAVFAIDAIQSISDELLDLFTKDEKQELALFTNVRRQQEYGTSRLVLKTMAREQLGVSEFYIYKDELGQPFGVSGAKKYHVSIAHSNDTVFCGISEDEAIGVDLEPVDREPSQKLRQRILHPDETNVLADIETIRLWTIKEAFIKLRGQGLRLNMNEVRVDKHGEQFTVEINNDKKAKICSFRTENNWLAIAHYQ